MLGQPKALAIVGPFDDDEAFTAALRLTELLRLARYVVTSLPCHRVTRRARW